MSGDRSSIDPGTLVIVVCFIAAVAGALFLAYRYSDKRTGMLRTFAADRKWDYARDDEQLRNRLEALFRGQVFSFSSILSSEDRSIRLFDCQNSYFNRSKSDRFSTGCIIASARFRTNGVGKDAVGVFDRNGVDGVWATDQLDIGEGAFAETFVVSAKDRTTARNLITPALQELLLEHRRAAARLTVGLDADGAAVMVNRVAGTDNLPDLIELCRKIETAMPR